MAEADRVAVVAQVAERRLSQREASVRLGLLLREAGGGPRPPAFEGDAAPVDDRGRALGVQVAPRGPRASESAAAGVRWGPGADRRLAARLVRGPVARLHADRVRGRRDDAAAGGGVLRAGDDRGVHAHGRPVACYSDRYSVFRINREGGEDRPTQFSRALLTLDIAGIHAGSLQAKGRVERANRTFQDRLVKEMRLPCRSSWRSSTGASRWRHATRRTRTGRCCTTPVSWT